MNDRTSLTQLQNRDRVAPQGPAPAAGTAVAPRKPAGPSLVGRIAARYGVDPTKMLATLKATAFKATKVGGVYFEVTNEEMMALLVIADAYHLNPFTREIYAFPDTKRGGIVPVVGVDGWIRIINEHPQMDGIEFEAEADGSAVTCRIWRKDRTRPITITEYFEECRRDTGPWNSHPRRMLRHKSLMQCGRVAFGFAGIYDEDEAARIVGAFYEPAAAIGGSMEREVIEHRQDEQQQGGDYQGEGGQVVDEETGEVQQVDERGREANVEARLEPKGTGKVETRQSPGNGPQSDRAPEPSQDRAPAGNAAGGPESGGQAATPEKRTPPPAPRRRPGQGKGAGGEPASDIGATGPTGSGGGFDLR